MTLDYLDNRYDWSEPDLVSIYDEASLWSAMHGALLLKYMPLRAGQRVLDLGTGTGFPLLEAAERTGSPGWAVGVDTWTSAARRASSKIARRKLSNATVCLGDAHCLPFATASFDLVTSNLTVNNLSDPAKALAEVRRVLAAGGSLALTTNLRGHMREFYAAYRQTLIDLGLRGLLPALRAHINHRASVAQLNHLLQTAGLDVCQVRRASFKLRFASGSALLRHSFIRLGFMDAWQAVLPVERQVEVFSALEAQLNRVAEREGEIRLTIPMAYVEARA